MQYSIEYTNGTDERFVKLCSQLDFYLQQLIGVEKQNKQYAQYNSLKDIHDVILIIDNGEAVGCGAIKRYDNHTMEMKRLYVKEEYRHKGYGRAIVEALEALAKNMEVTTLILETGVLLVAAQNMYISCGFKVIENYGQYKGLEGSICMNKQLP